MPHPLSGTVERRLSGAVAGRRDSGTAGPGSRRGSSALAGRVEAAREQRTRLLSISKSSMKGSFDIQSFLDEKDLDIAGRLVELLINIAPRLRIYLLQPSPTRTCSRWRTVQRRRTPPASSSTPWWRSCSTLSTRRTIEIQLFW